MANLVTLADYKEYKKLTKTDDDDNLNALITSISQMIKTYCGHSFIDYYSVDKEEIFNVGCNQNSVILNEWPINSITSVQYRSTYDEAYETEDSSEYYMDMSSDALFKHSGYWPMGFGSLKVTYKGGYSETPEDLKVAVFDLVTHYFKEEYKERRSIGAASIDNSTRFNSSKFSVSKWPAHIVRVLDLYRNV